MNRKKLIKILIYAVCFALAGLLFYKTFVPLAPHLWEALKSGDESQIEAFLKESGQFKGLFYLFLSKILYFCTWIRVTYVQYILLNSFTITTASKRATTNIGTAPNMGADFPYLVVVCGEP